MAERIRLLGRGTDTTSLLYIHNSHAWSANPTGRVIVSHGRPHNRSAIDIWGLKG